MRNSPFRGLLIVGLLVFVCGASIWAISSPASAAPANVSDIAGTYELTRRVMSNGEEMRPPAIVALYKMDHGRGNFNLFVKNKDGTLGIRVDD
jgi:hypothetical protein